MNSQIDAYILCHHCFHKLFALASLGYHFQNDFILIIFSSPNIKQGFLTSWPSLFRNTEFAKIDKMEMNNCLPLIRLSRWHLWELGSMEIKIFSTNYWKWRIYDMSVLCVLQYLKNFKSKKHKKKKKKQRTVIGSSWISQHIVIPVGICLSKVLGSCSKWSFSSPAKKKTKKNQL